MILAFWKGSTLCRKRKRKSCKCCCVRDSTPRASEECTSILAPQLAQQQRLGRFFFSQLWFSVDFTSCLPNPLIFPSPLPMQLLPQNKTRTKYQTKEKGEGEKNILMDAVTWPGEFSPHFQDPGASSLTCRRWQMGKGDFPSPTPPYGRCVSAVFPRGRLPCVPTHTVSSTVLPS